MGCLRHFPVTPLGTNLRYGDHIYLSQNLRLIFIARFNVKYFKTPSPSRLITDFGLHLRFSPKVDRFNLALSVL